MRAFIPSSSLFLSFLAPALVAASAQIPLAAPEQLLFDSPALRRAPPSTRPQSGSSQPMFPSRPNPSVVVAVVDPASPTTSSIVEPSMLAEADEAENDQEDAANFGASCTFESHSFKTCGDFYDEVSGIDHGLFCSPSGICGGKGAACGASEACDDGLVCNLSTHRCVKASAKLLSIENARKASRRESAMARCPDGAQACPSGIGGFECVFIATEDTECGGCLNFGGRNCAAIPHALATSCRGGECIVHACVAGYHPDAGNSECVDDMFA
ncbi:hypothetical protein NBRC10512_006923 [Rhodotorula toruloides]|uniref:RHTO0S02e12200g1_1 n=2 Tax=Rhodotorula toruloides TaxID=5286 RepID=A0A061APB6_RHOTO|nr:uncharacterized protein RHTO_07239 [Rhodotorula toruloides NP11]EMS23505.1 hypothetical protein RHTO_07239 [Rhodotorula toruloides NP11]KAJ8296586.1 Protein priA [Rhodotorula toruloides]CDR37221.1 RHTO0S02e12200g1_1 [Rhodotorula toruloides]